jgi:LytR cell envelope-related transcriptional attenuator
MNDLIEKIGPFLGVAAFLGLAILAFLIFQQAREVRRLREWAGRGPERAAEAAEAALAAAEARGEAVEEDPAEVAVRGRVGSFWAGVRERLGPRFAWLDRRMPVDPRYLLALLAAGVVAAAVLTSGFGLIGGDEGNGAGGGKAAKKEKPDKVEVAVLNGTQVVSETTGETIPGVVGLADEVGDKVIKPAGYSVGEKTNAAAGVDETVIMFESSEDGDASANEQEAQNLAEAVADQLGETEVTPMVQEVRDLAGGAPLAIVIGADDEDF